MRQITRGIALFLGVLALVACGQQETEPASVPKATEKPAIVSGENEQFKYTDREGSIWLDSYEGAAATLTLPEQIDGTPVTGISNYAFEGSAIEKIVIPQSIKTIGERAFLDCTQLKEIVIESEDLQVQMSAFIGCENVERVTKPETAKHMLFIGNSLTYYAGVPSHMKSILTQTGRSEYNVMSAIKLGEKLSTHLEDRKQTGLNVALQLADTIVVQDAWIGPASKPYVKKLRKICGDDVTIYYWLTDWLEKERRLKITDTFEGFCDLKILNTGDVFDSIVSEGIYTPAQMWVKEDNHPNTLYGYFSSMYMFRQLFGENVSNLPDLEYLAIDVTDWLTTENKTAEMKKVKKVQTLLDTEY